MKIRNLFPHSATRLAKLATMSLAIGASGTLAHATSYTFSQMGFDEGAMITGGFTAEDTDANGWISFDSLGFDREVSDFFLNFSGNSMVSAFTLGYSELAQLVFFADGDNMLGNDFSPTDPFGGLEGIAAFSDDYLFATGLLGAGVSGGFVQDINFGGVSETPSAVMVDNGSTPTNAVPDSGSTVLLLGLGLVGLATAKRRFL